MNNKNKGLDMNFENLSEEDLYSDEDEIANYADNIPDGGKGMSGLPSAQADRRAHHNALERKRRDHIKDSFSSLRDAVPTLKGDKVKASRAQILKKAADYIGNLKERNESCESDIEEILKQNKALLEKVRTIETRAQANGIPLPPSIKSELPTPQPAATTTTPASKPLPQTKSTPLITTVQRTLTPAGGGGTSLVGPASVISSGSASVITSGTASVITGGSGTVKLDANGKATANGKQIIILKNPNWTRLQNDTRTNTVVIPASSSRLVTNGLKQSFSTFVLERPPEKKKKYEGAF